MPQRSLYLIVALVIVTGAAYLVFDARTPEAPPPPPSVSPAPLPAEPTPLPQPVADPVPEPGVDPAPEAEVAAPVAPPPPPLPALAHSDDEVRAAFAPFGLPAPWLERAGLLQRAATVLVNLSVGTLPRRQLAFLAPVEPFKVVKEGERFFVDPAGYERFAPLMDALEQVPPQELAGVLRRYEPLLDEALGQLGERNGVEQFVARASDAILARRPVSGRVELVRPNVLFQFADPALEEASELDKQLLRVGPDNLERLQRYVRRVREAYDAERL